MIADADANLVSKLVAYINSQKDMEVIDTARDGLEANYKILENNADIVILDMGMPQLEGLEVLEEISKNVDVSPIFIVLSLNKDDRMTQMAIMRGARTCLMKPLKLDVLVEKIRKIIKSKLDMPYKINAIFDKIGIPKHCKGYKYLQEAVIAGIKNVEVINNMTGQVYPNLAKKYKTTPARVERAIRYAIEMAWEKGRIEAIENIFGYTINSNLGKPTNSEFIAMLTEKLRLEC